MNNEKYSPSVLVCKGKLIKAAYCTSTLPSCQNNPLIEALPPIWTQDEVNSRLSYSPTYENSQRRLPAHLRLHLIQNTLQFFVPLPIHFDLEQQFSHMIRAGYQARNPALTGFWQDIPTRVRSLEMFHHDTPSSTATGFTILGISGIGKTTSVEAILSLYPQVIFHNHYRGHDFMFIQIVWLKLDCPFDGSIKGLCINFFQAVDDLLGTNYYTNYARERKTVEKLLHRIGLIASLHSIGVLVIDEIQHLSQAKNGGSRRILNFFVQLINTIGLPVVLIGTYKALSTLNSEFQQTCKGMKQSNLLWDRMKKDDDWQQFLERLWIYQYTRQPSKLKVSLSDALYKVTQGITDFAVKVYMLAQVQAIVTGEEIITVKGIYQAAEEGLKMARPILVALEKDNMAILHSIKDVHPINLDSFLQDAQSQLN